MMPEMTYIARALEYARLANHAADFETRQSFRCWAISWLRLAEYARQRRETPVRAR